MKGILVGLGRPAQVQLIYLSLIGELQVSVLLLLRYISNAQTKKLCNIFSPEHLSRNSVCMYFCKNGYNYCAGKQVLLKVISI
jgi:hypothetical protein